jgi:hypothetical protein
MTGKSPNRLGAENGIIAALGFARMERLHGKADICQWHSSRRGRNTNNLLLRGTGFGWMHVHVATFD